MKIFYTSMGFGDVYFDPATHKVVIDDRNGHFTAGELGEGYRQEDFPESVREYEVPDDVFPKFYSAALLFMSSQRDLREALKNFPKE